MANSLNDVRFIGNLTKDVEVKSVGATEVAKFSVALNKTWKDANGEYKETVTYADCELWGKMAGVFANVMKKGSRAYLQAEFTQQSWEDKEGNTRRSTVFKVNPVSWIDLSGKKSNQGESKNQYVDQNQDQEEVSEIPF